MRKITNKDIAKAAMGGSGVKKRLVLNHLRVERFQQGVLRLRDPHKGLPRT